MSYGDKRMGESQDLLFRVRISWDEGEYVAYGWKNGQKEEFVEVGPAGSILFGPYTEISVTRRKRTVLLREHQNYRQFDGRNLRAEIEACMPEWKAVE